MTKPIFFTLAALITIGLLASYWTAAKYADHAREAGRRQCVESCERSGCAPGACEP